MCPFGKYPLFDGIGVIEKITIFLRMLWSDQAVACKFDFEIIIIFTKILQNALEMEAKNGFQNALSSI